MTLDEAIEQFKYDAECNRADLDLSFAEDNDKVAEWLDELKAYQSICSLFTTPIQFLTTFWTINMFMRQILICNWI